MTYKDPVIIFIVEEDELLTMGLKHEIGKAFEPNQVLISTFRSIAEYEGHLKQKPDIVIADDRLTGVNNNLIDTIKRINTQTQVILLSREDNTEIAVKALNLGVHDYIIKNDQLFKKLRLSLIQCFTILELRRNMKKQVSLGILTIVIVFLMFSLAVGLSACVPDTFR